MMELSELVREIESAPDPTAQARIERSRAVVMRKIVTPDQKARRRSRWIWGGTAAAGTVTAGAVVAAIVVAGAVSPITAQPASAAAVAVLNDAANVVINGEDPVVGPGQYLRVRETYEVVSLWDADADPSDPVAGFNGSELLTSEGAIRARGVRDLYVPSDRSDDWIVDDRFKNEVLDVYGDAEVMPAYDRYIAAVPERDADPDGIESLPAGLQTWRSDSTLEDQYWDPFRNDYPDMPRDPEQLLNWYREHLPGSDGDWFLFQTIGRYLSTDVMPADLRASSLRVLGLLEGVDVASTDGAITTLAISEPLEENQAQGDLLVSELDINTSTGRIVGSRETYPNRSTELLPSGQPWVSWSIDVAVVDEAPMP